MKLLLRKTLLVTLLLVPSMLSAEELIRTYDELKASLDKAGMKYQEKKASNMVILSTSKGSYKGAQLIIWRKDSGVVHFMESLGVIVPKERLADTETAFLRLNHGLRIPGLGINYKNGRVYFRTSVPLTPRGGIPESEVKNYSRLILREAVDVLPTVKAIIENKIKPEQAVAYYSASLQKNKKNNLKVGRYTKELGGKSWLLTLDVKGNLQLAMNGNVVVKSNVTLKGNQISIKDSGGPLAAKTPGTYKWDFQKGKLTFQKIKDDSNGREKVLTTGAWKYQVKKK